MPYLLAIDTETDLIVPGRLAPRLTCVSWATPDGSAGVYDHMQALAPLREWLTDPECIILGHNIAYDFCVIAAEYPELLVPIFKAYEAGRVCDTLLREKLIDIATARGAKGRYKLDAIALRRCGIALDKNTHRLGYGPLRYVPIAQWPAGAREYATDDAKATLAVYRDQHSEADDYRDTSPGKDYALVDELAQVRVAFALQLMSCWGIRTDRARIDAFEAQLLPEFEQLRAALLAAGVLEHKRATRKQQAAGVDPGVKRSRKLVEAYVDDAYTTRGDVVPLTDKGRVSTSRRTLQATQDALLVQVARYGELEKLFSTYLPLLRRGQDVPMNTYYGLVNSGRTSSSPNFQNLPRAAGTRECFTARPGYVYCSVDYDTAELRALAAYCEEQFGYSRMADALRAGQDLHVLMAAGILGRTYDDCYAVRKTDPDVKHARQLAKQCNFGLGGGMGPDKFVETCAKDGIVITRARAVELKRLWLAQWPEMVEFFQQVAAATVGGQGDFTTPWSGRLRAQCYYSEMANAAMQSPVADAAKAALFAVAYECYTGEYYPGTPGANPGEQSPLYGSRPVLFLHDEIITELVDDERLTAAAERQAALQRAVAERTIRTIPMTCEPALMRVWSKAATAVRGERGELVPYAA